MKPIKGPSKAEFERDRRELDAAIGERMQDDSPSDDVEPEQAFADAELLRRFHIKHRARLEAQGIDVGAYLAELAGTTQTLVKASETEARATEAHLQALANRAEAEAKVIENTFRVLRFYESKTEEEWATLSWEEQQKTREVIDELRESMPELLARLPIERRRALEAEELPPPEEGAPDGG